MDRTIKRSKIPKNYEYNEVSHSDVPIYEYVDVGGCDVLYVVEMHYPHTDMKFFASLRKKMDAESALGFKVGLIILGDTLDTPRNGKLRGNYPKMTPKEVVENFEGKILNKIHPYLVVWILNNHDFEFMDIKDWSDKIGYNIWKKFIAETKKSGVFTSKRVVKAKGRNGIKFVFEHEHLMATTVKNRSWKFHGFDYRIFAGRHESFRNENIYEGDMDIGKNIGVPPMVTGLFQYAEEHMNPPLIARALRIAWNKNKKDYDIEEI